MYSIDESVKEQIRELNKSIQNKFGDILNIEQWHFKKMLQDVGSFYKLQQLNSKELQVFGSVVGVDGSVNKMGGLYPHYVELYQGLAKFTNGKEIFINEIYTPLLERMDSTSELENDLKSSLNKNKKLAQIEISAAIESAKMGQRGIIIMDGGLIRYKIHDSLLWEELREMCLDENIILVGLIKDIKTNIIAGKLFNREDIFDRELLYGKLEYKDLLLIDDSVNKKFEEGFSSAFMRPSKSASVVGVDIIMEQRESLVDAANLIFSLTPEDSRGVPLWLDIVDSEVKVSDAYMKALLEEFLDRDIYNRFFVSERALRTM